MSSLGVLLRLAWGLIRRSASTSRWRLIAVPACVAFATVIALSGASLWGLASKLVAREGEVRTATLVQERVDADFALLPSSDLIEGKEILVAWVEPLRSAALTKLPGVAGALAPGHAAVSPAVDELVTARSPAAARHYPRRVLIGREALRAPDELVAYVRPARIGSIRDDPDAILFATDGRAQPRVPVFFASRTEFRPGLDLYFGLIFAAGLPCVLLAWLAATVGAARRRERTAMLAWIGAPPGATGFLAATETMILSIPGVVVAAAVYVPLSKRLREIPIVGQPVFAGDLAVGLGELGAAAGVLLAVIAFVSLVAGMRAAQTSSSAPRPVVPARWKGRLRLATRLIVFALAAVSLIAYFFVPSGSSLAQPVVGAAAIALLLAIPLASTALLAGAAQTILRLPGPLPLLAGRQLARVGNRDVRPFAAGGVVLAAVVALTGLYARQSDPVVGPAPPTQAAMLRWSAPRAGDVRAIERALAEASIFPATRTNHGLNVHATCLEVARVVRAKCSEGGAMIKGFLEEQLAVAPGGVAFARATDLGHARAHPVARDHGLAPRVDPKHRRSRHPLNSAGQLPEQIVPDAALIVASKPDRSLSERIYGASMASAIPRPLVDVKSWSEAPLPLFVRWLALIGIFAGGAVVLALVVAQADTLSAQTREARVLPRMGMSPQSLRRMIALRHATIAACCCAVGFGSGLAIAFTLTNGTEHHFRPAWSAYAAEAAIAVGAVVVGAWLSWIATGDTARDL